MIGIVIVTHGRLAQEFISAMEHMVGPQTHLRAVCIGPEDDIERRRRELAAAAKSVDMGNGVVLVTDMYGGTPCNLALTLLERGKIEVLAGTNLPSLIKLVDVRAKLPLDEAVKEAIEAGRKYMRAGSADRAEFETMNEPVRRRAVVAIPNKRGLHARASAKLVEAAARFKSNITVTKDGQSVDARSIMGLMMLAASQGSEIEIVAEGPDADDAMTAILALVEAKFGED